MGPRRLVAVLVASSLVVYVTVVLAAAAAWAQEIDITPAPSVEPTTETTPWLVQMAIAASIIGVLVVVGLLLFYLRFAPKFFGREEAAKPPPPGTRPPLLARPVRQAPRSPTTAAASPAAPRAAHAAASSVTGPATEPAPHATGVEPQRAPAPDLARRPAAVSAPSASEGTTEGEVATAAASAVPTAGPGGEPAVQADAVGESEVASPEERPSAKTLEDVAASAEGEAVGATGESADVETPSTVPSGSATSAAARGDSSLDQETFDRVLREQLERGVDRRVAEGRARAAAVVAARRKSQA